MAHQQAMTAQTPDDALAYEATQRLAAIVESSHDAIISKTLSGTITSWNRAAERMYGYTAAEAIGRPVQMLLPADRLHEEMAILAQLSEGLIVEPFETVRLHKNGQRVDVQVTISPIRDATGRIVGGSKIARDITSQKQAEAARQRAQRLEAEIQHIQDACRLRSQFLANMSHELRTPLNAVIGFADLLKSRVVPVDSPRYDEFLGHIASSGRHLLELINSMLDLSKVESGKMDFSPEPVDLRHLVRETCAMVETSARTKQIHLQAEVDANLEHVELDPTRFKQVLLNYLANAIKFTPEGGRVTVQALPEGADQLRLEVTDTGIGIAQSDLPRLFVEFQQLDNSFTKKYQGTGLGLALTRRLVQAQGGRVGVTSTLGVGSIFYLVLPRRPIAAPAPMPGPSHRLLVIDHNPAFYQRLMDALTHAGLQVDVASTPQQALGMADQHDYDGITLDLRLHNQGGHNTLAGLRQSGASPLPPVRAMTLQIEDNGSAAFAVADVLSKPIDTREVLQSLARTRWPEGRKARILVIDDEAPALSLMQATLERAGHTAYGFQDATLALAALDTLQPDAIILDLMMPVMNGFQFLAALRAMPAWKELPVFIWTALSLSDQELAELHASAQEVMGKGGASLGDVVDSLAAGLANHRQGHYTQ